MSKRTATSNLTKDNWDEEEKSEEMGTYQMASANELKMRSIKRARRRGVAGGGEGPSIFKNFKAFSSSESDTAAPPTFSFLSEGGEKPKLVTPKSFPSFSFNKPNDQTKDNDKKTTTTSGIISNTSSSPLGSSSNGNKGNNINENKDSLKSTFKFGIDNKLGTESSSGSPITSFNFNPTKSNSESSTFKFGVNPTDSKTNSVNEKLQFNFGTKSGSKISSENSVSDNTSKTKTTAEIQKDGKVNGVKSETEKSNLFLANLKALNYGVLNWVQKHIEKNQYINLTPIFEDYKKHFEDIKKNYDTNEKKEKEKVPDESEESSKSPQSPAKTVNSSESEPKKTTESPASLFSFGSTNSSVSNPRPFTFGYTETIKTDILNSPEANKSSEVKPFTFGFKSPNSGSNESSQKTTNFTFGLKEKPPTFSFGSSDNKPTFSFGNTDPNKKLDFSFGYKEKSSSDFTFGKSENPSKPVFSFTPSSSESNDNSKSEVNTKEKEEEGEGSDEVPKVEVNEVKEENAVYEKKVKLFYKKEDKYVDKGVGTLFLKPAGEKTQLLVRALTNLGNILLNIILNESIPTQRVGKNNVLLVCVPNPPIDPKASDTPVSMLIRVKTESDADELLEKINEHKK